MLITRMLIMAPAATREIRAAGEDSLRRSLDDLVDSGACKPWLLLDQRRLDFFVRENKRHKHSLAAPVFIGRQARQSVAAVNQLFDCEEQELILRYCATDQPFDARSCYSALPAAAPELHAH